MKALWPIKAILSTEETIELLGSVHKDTTDDLYRKEKQIEDTSIKYQQSCRRYVTKNHSAIASLLL